MTPKPKIKTTERDGKIAVWVIMPNGMDWNITDVTRKEWTDKMEFAIRSAFARGYQYAKMQVMNVLE